MKLDILKYFIYSYLMANVLIPWLLRLKSKYLTSNPNHKYDIVIAWLHNLRERNQTGGGGGHKRGRGEKCEGLNICELSWTIKCANKKHLQWMFTTPGV